MRSVLKAQARLGSLNYAQKQIGQLDHFRGFHRVVRHAGRLKAACGAVTLRRRLPGKGTSTLCMSESGHRPTPVTSSVNMRTTTDSVRHGLVLCSRGQSAPPRTPGHATAVAATARPSRKQKCAVRWSLHRARPVCRSRWRAASVRAAPLEGRILAVLKTGCG